MGNSHCMIVNKTHKKICILTFNQADLVYGSYVKMYVLEPGESEKVESATADPIGLKIGVAFEAETESRKVFYQMWKCKNGSQLTITYINGGDISTFGDHTQSQEKNFVYVRDSDALNVVVSALSYVSPLRTRLGK